MFHITGGKKIISMAIMAVFFCVIGVSAYPLHAQAQVANPEQPGAVEKIGTAGAPASGGSILPILLIGVGVLAVTAVLVLVVFKTSYDITGTWTFVFTYVNSNHVPATLTATFTGTKESGTWTMSKTQGGAYTVNDKTVTMTWEYPPTTQMTGTFTAKDAMSGTMSNAPTNESFTWVATRGVTAAVTPSFSAGSGLLGQGHK